MKKKHNKTRVQKASEIKSWKRLPNWNKGLGIGSVIGAILFLIITMTLFEEFQYNVYLLIYPAVAYLGSALIGMLIGYSIKK